MKKLNTFIEKNFLLIITIYFLVQPFLDVMTFINTNVPITIGMAFRFLFMAFAIYYILFINNNKKRIWIYLGSLFIYGLLFLIPYLNNGLLFLELKSLLKVYYFIILLILFYTNKDKLKEFDYKYLNYIFIIYILFIIIPNLIGNFGSYDIAKIGEKGLFNSANEIGAILSFLFPVYLYKMFDNKNKIKYIPIIVLYICTIFIIGTKVPVMAFLITVLFFSIKYFVEIIKKKQIKQIIILSSSLITLILFSIIIVPKTPFYNNIKTHMNYFGINNVKEIFTKYENLDNIIFSERLSLTEENMAYYKNQSTYKKLLGSGYYEIKEDSILERKTAEIDYIDIFVSYGIVGTLLFFVPVIYLLTNFAIRFKNLEKKQILYLTLYFLIFSIALFSGHIFVAPAVSIYLAMFLTS